MPGTRVIWLLALTVLAAAATDAGEELAVRDIGSFYVGGRSVAARDGDYETGQVYVQYVRLVRPRVSVPLVLLPGGSVSGVTYETTPDGRAGWQLIFLRRGYSVYVADTSYAGRAPWARFRDIHPDEPLFRTKQFLWEVFRLGPEGSFAAEGGPRAYTDTRFPVASFRELARQAMPRFRMSPDLERSAYDELLTRVCPCMLLAHSAAGSPTLGAVQRHPGLIAGVIAVEPSAAASLAAQDLARAASVPHLFVWGDHLDLGNVSGSWAQQYSTAKRYHEALRAAGGHSVWIHLPDIGIRGNSHLLMMDDNSADIAGRIDTWIRSLR